MDENDVIVIDTRNASILPGVLNRTGSTRPPVVVTRPQPQPMVVQSPTAAGAVYVRDPATGALVREQLGATAPAVVPTTAAQKLAALSGWKLGGFALQALALLMARPSGPSPTGDIAKDTRNNQIWAEANALTEQRIERLQTLGAMMAQVG